MFYDDFQNLDAHSILARLFAKEDIDFQVTMKDKTPSFNLKTRVLSMPNYDIDYDTHVMILTHEISHALHTPHKEWIGAINRYEEKYRDCFKIILNIVEDARIEKLIINKYPGLERFYIKGCEVILDYLGIPLDSFVNKADKINMWFKTQYYFDAGMVLTPDEQDIVDRMKQMMTFKSVISIADELFNMIDDETKQQKDNQSTKNGDGEQGDETGEGSECSDGKETNPSKFSNMFKDGFTDKLQQFLEDKQKDTDNVKTGSSVCDVQRGKHKTSISRIPNSIVSTHYPIRTQHLRKQAKDMSMMFERKKKEHELKKIRFSKTGILNVNKLYSYSYDDDLFLESETVRQTENHGFMFLLDCSISMKPIWDKVIENLFVLIDFCRNSNIYFALYGFHSDLGSKKVLFKIASSTDKKRDIDSSFEKVHGLKLGATPLISAMYAMMNEIHNDKVYQNKKKKFLVLMTDGQATDGFQYSTYESYRDPISKARKQYATLDFRNLICDSAAILALIKDVFKIKSIAFDIGNHFGIEKDVGAYDYVFKISNNQISSKDSKFLLDSFTSFIT